MMTLESAPTRSDVPWRNIDGNVVVVQPKEGILYPLNGVATKIWLLLDGKHRVKEIIEALHEEFEAEVEDIEKDAFSFLETLEKTDLIRT